METNPHPDTRSAKLFELSNGLLAIDTAHSTATCNDNQCLSYDADDK